MTTPLPPGPDLLAAVRATPSRTRSQHLRHARRSLVLGGLGLVGVCALHGAEGILGKPLSFTVATAGGTAFAAAVATAPLFRFGASLLGPATTALRAAALGALALAVGAVGAGYGSHPELGFVWSDVWRGGHAACVGISLSLGLGLSWVGTAALRRAAPGKENVVASLVALSVGLWTLAAVTLQCPRADLAHAIVGHAVPAVLMGGLSYGWARAFVGLTASPPSLPRHPGGEGGAGPGKAGWQR